MSEEKRVTKGRHDHCDTTGHLLGILPDGFAVREGMHEDWVTKMNKYGCDHRYCPDCGKKLSDA